MRKLLLILAIFSNYALAVGPVNIKKSGPSKQHSEFSIYPGIGYGSSGNKIRRFTAANSSGWEFLPYPLGLSFQSPARS